MGRGGEQQNSTKANRAVSLEELSKHRTPEDGKRSLLVIHVTSSNRM